MFMRIKGDHTYKDLRIVQSIEHISTKEILGFYFLLVPNPQARLHVAAMEIFFKSKSDRASSMPVFSFETFHGFPLYLEENLNSHQVSQGPT